MIRIGKHSSLLFKILLLTTGLAYPVSIQAQQPVDKSLSKRENLDNSDKRLQVNVFLPSGQYRIGELLEILTTQTGVTLTAKDRDMVAGEVLFVSLKDVKLTDVMKALTSLYSYPSAPWRWQQEKKEQIIYVLKRPRSSQDVSHTLKDKLQGECIDLEKEMLDHCNSDDALNTVFKKHGLQSDPGSIAIHREWLGLLKDSIAKEDIDPLLRGSKSIDVSFDTSTPIRDLYESTVRRMLGQIPENLKILSRVDELTGITDIWIGGKSTSADGRTSSEGYRGLTLCYLYGKKRGAEMASDWITRDDDRTNPAIENQLFVAPLPEKPAQPEKTSPSWSKQYPEIKFLNELQEVKQISYMARLPYRSKSNFPSLGDDPYGQPIGDFLKDKLGSFDLYYKWNSKFLLVSYPAWIVPDTVLPWEFTKAIRQSVTEYDLANPTKPWSYNRVYQLAAQGSDLDFQQWSIAGEESLVLQNVGEWYPLFARALKSETFRSELLTRRGIALDRVLALSDDPGWAEQFNNPQYPRPIARVRMWQGKSNTGVPFIGIGFLDKEAKWMGGTTFDLWVNPHPQ